MARARGMKVTDGGPPATAPVDRICEEYKPSSEWIEDSKCHYLLLEVPDFRKQDVKIQINDSGHVNIKGQRQVANRSKFFEQSYKVPRSSDIQKTTGRFEGGLLTVKIPKQKSCLILQKCREEISKNKGMIITAVLAVSLGVLVAHYAESDHHDESPN